MSNLLFPIDNHLSGDNHGLVLLGIGLPHLYLADTRANVGDGGSSRRRIRAGDRCLSAIKSSGQPAALALAVIAGLRHVPRPLQTVLTWNYIYRT